MGGPRSETGADHGEREAEHGEDAEAEDQGSGQVHADGGHQLAVERPAVDGVTMQRLGQPDGVVSGMTAVTVQDGGLQARAERPAGPPRRSPTRDDRSGGRAIAFNYNSRRLQLSGETPLLPRRGDLP
jgi:hypothetical protein